MKNIIYIVLLLSQILFAKNDFEEGNTLYKKGNYSEAIKAYETVLSSKKHSAELYFNMANCYYKMNKIAPAIFYYEKALLLNPTDVEIKNNLLFAEKLKIDEIKEVPKVGFAKWLQNFTSLYHYNTWAWIAVIIAFLFLGLFLGYYFSETTLSKRFFFIGMSVALVLVCVSLAAAFFEKTSFENEKPAIVFSEITPLKSEPKSSSPDVLVLHEGTKVMIKEALDNYRKVQLVDETTGWIEASAIKEVKD
jgi:tetratricopeptide (TPR) repeat protein